MSSIIRNYIIRDYTGVPCDLKAKLEKKKYFLESSMCGK